MAKKKIPSCICLTCGVRNDHSHEDGWCQNDHDDWLEYRDVYLENEHFDRALELTEMSSEDFKLSFMDNSIKQFELKPQEDENRN